MRARPANLLPACAAVAAASTLAGCADINQFDASYVGERWPAVGAASVVQDAPPDAQARIIGESTFNTTNQFLGDGDACAAARARGADLVRWERAWEGTATRLETMPIYQSGIQNRGVFATYVFVPADKSMWRYYARYYRSRSMGGAFDGYVGLPAGGVGSGAGAEGRAPDAPAPAMLPRLAPAPITSPP